MARQRSSKAAFIVLTSFYIPKRDVTKEEVLAVISKLMEENPERAREFQSFRLYYGLDAEPMSCGAIGRILRVSAKQAGELRNRAATLLRDPKHWITESEPVPSDEPSEDIVFQLHLADLVKSLLRDANTQTHDAAIWVEYLRGWLVATSTDEYGTLLTRHSEPLDSQAAALMTELSLTRALVKNYEIQHRSKKYFPLPSINNL